MASIKKCFSKNKVSTAELLAWLGVGVGLSVAAGVWLKNQNRSEAPREGSSNASGSVPHTDYDAAAAIGRQTGGEVFDD